MPGKMVQCLKTTQVCWARCGTGQRLCEAVWQAERVRPPFRLRGSPACLPARPACLRAQPHTRPHFQTPTCRADRKPLPSSYPACQPCSRQAFISAKPRINSTDRTNSTNST